MSYTSVYEENAAELLGRSNTTAFEPEREREILIAKAQVYATLHLAEMTSRLVMAEERRDHPLRYIDNNDYTEGIRIPVDLIDRARDVGDVYGQSAQEWIKEQVEKAVEGEVSFDPAPLEQETNPVERAIDSLVKFFEDGGKARVENGELLRIPVNRPVKYRDITEDIKKNREAR